MGERRFPFAAVAPMVADLTARQIAEIVDAKVNTVQRWRSVGVATIPETTAERLALWLDVHPETIWPDWYSDLMRACAECAAMFLPDLYNPNQQYCSRNCRARAWGRERRQDAAFRAAENARRVSYGAEYRERLNAVERRRYAANREAINARRRARRAQPERQAS